MPGLREEPRPVSATCVRVTVHPTADPIRVILSSDDGYSDLPLKAESQDSASNS
jgi:hypothetical protein